MRTFPFFAASFPRLSAFGSATDSFRAYFKATPSKRNWRKPFFGEKKTHSALFPACVCACVRLPVLSAPVSSSLTACRAQPRSGQLHSLRREARAYALCGNQSTVHSGAKKGIHGVAFLKRRYHCPHSRGQLYLRSYPWP